MKENSQSIRPSNFNNLSTSNMRSSKFDDTKFINSSVQETSQKQIYKFKIILLGDVSVGKTSLLTYFIENKFTEEYKATISAEFKTKILNVSQNVQASLNIWDTAGNERFKSITKQYFRDADGVILVYDIGRRETFNNIKFWIDEIENNSNKDIIIFLVGNKCDLVQKRNISFEEGEKLSKDLDVFFMEVSAKSGQNVFLLFEQITNYLCQNAENSRDFDYDDNDNNINNKSYNTNNLKSNFIKNNIDGNLHYNTEKNIVENKNIIIPITDEKIKLFKVFVGNSKLSNKIILSYFDNNPKIRLAGEKYFKSKYGCDFLTLNFIYPTPQPHTRQHRFNFASDINEIFIAVHKDFPSLINPKLILENGKEIINNKKVKCIGALNLNNNSVIKVFKQ